MSADNCIGVLRTITKDGKHEWRVADHHMVWNDDFERVKVDISEKLSFLYCYRNSKVYQTADEANEVAYKLEDNGYYEYGISDYELDVVYPDQHTLDVYKELSDKCSEFGNKTQKWPEAHAELKRELIKTVPQYA